MKTRLILLFAVLVLGVRQTSWAAPATFTDPASNSFQADSVKITHNLPSTLLMQVVFTMGSGYYYNTSIHADTIQFTSTGSGTFYMNPATLSSHTLIINGLSGITSIPDGTYSVLGRFSSNNGVIWSNMGSARTNVKIDTKTLPDTIFKPSTGATVGSSFTFYDSTYEKNKTGTKQLFLSGTNSYTLTLTDAQKDSFALNTLNPTSSSAVTAFAGGNGTSIDEGTYTMTLSYQDSLGHAAATTSKTITIDRTTQTPTLTFPTSGSTLSSITAFQYTLPEQPFPGSVVAYFLDPYGTDTLLTLHLSNNFGSMQSVYVNYIPSEYYDITLSYSDIYNNPVATMTATDVYVLDYTWPASLYSPVDDGHLGTQMNIRFQLGELPSAASLIFQDSTSTDTIVLQSSNLACLNTFTLNAKDLLSSPYVQSATVDSLKEGWYTKVYITYMDQVGNPAVSDSVTMVYLDLHTDPAMLYQPVASYTGNTIPVQYALSETPWSQSVQLIFTGAGVTDTLTLDDEAPGSLIHLNPHDLVFYPITSATMDSLPDGVYNVQLSYQDYLGNPAATITHDSITIDTYTQTPAILNPDSFSKSGLLLNIVCTIPEAYSTASLIINGAGTSDTLVLQNLPVGTDTFALNVHRFSTSTYVHSFTADSINDGAYGITLTYQDASGNPAASAMVSNITIDTHTQAPVINSPVSHSAMTEQMNINVTIPEAYSPGSVLLSFSNADTSYAMGLRNLAVGTNSFTLDAHHLSSSSNVSSASGDSIMDGLYTISLTYIDSLGNPSASTKDSSITIDTYTQSPSILLPFSHTASTSPLKVVFSLPEMYKAGSLKLTFDSAGVVKNTIVLTGLTTGIDSVMLNIVDLIASAHVQSASADSITDGIYNITLSYQDTLGNAPATAVDSNIIIDMHTQVPVILLPVSSSKNGSLLNTVFTIPEAYSSGTLKLIFNGAVTDTLVLQNLPAGTDTFALNAHRFSTSVYVRSSTIDSLNDGVYSITLSYQDALGNPAASVTVSNVTIDMHTQAPVITLPTASSTVRELMNLHFSIPEAYLPGSILLSFSNADTSYTMRLSNIAVGANNLVLDAHNLLSSSNVSSASGDSILDGLYTISLIYIDSLGNPSASTTDSSVTIDTYTQAPVLLSPVNGLLVGGGNPLPISFTLPETPQANSVTITLDNGVNPVCTLILNTDSAGTSGINLNPHHLLGTPGLVMISYDSLFDGSYTVALTYQDYLGNPVATANPGTMILDEATQSPVILAPANSGTIINLMNFVFTIPENYKPNSLKLVFDSAGVKDTVLLKNTMPVGTDTLTLESYNITGNFFVQSATKNNLGDGVYTITLSYQDSLGNPVASATVTNVTLDQETTPPVLISPTGVLQATSSVFNLQYTLPETPFSGSVQVAFINNGSSCYIGLDESSAGSKADLLDLKSIPTSFAVSSHSCNSLDDGTYKVVLIYQDAFDNGIAVSDTGLLIIDTQTLTPSLTLPGSGSTNNAMIDVSFTLPENALNSTASLSFASLTDTITIDLQTTGTGLQSYTLNGDNLSATSGYLNASQSTIPDGAYTLMLTYQDTLSNPLSSVSQNSIEILRSIVTGIHEATGNNSVNIYPNPSNGMFTIKGAKEGNYSIVDETGQIVEVVNLSSANNYSVNARTLHSGIYFIVGFNGNSVIHNKLVVTKE